MNNIIFNDIKVLLTGYKNVIDILDICEYYKKKYPDNEKLINSIINGKINNNNLNLSLREFSSLIKEISNMEYKEDIEKIIEDIQNKRFLDDIQKDTISRIIDLKLNKPNNYSENNVQVVKLNIVKKNCPHCNNICYAEKNSEYVICGYTNPIRGYDMTGCGRDWCFKCGKILCKNWEANSLYLESNRCHHMDCCKNHAAISGKNWPDDYCHCINENVNRNNLNILISSALKTNI